MTQSYKLFALTLNKYLITPILCLVPIVLILLPIDFFDKGKSICFSVIFFNEKCYGCGITRSLQHLIHLDLNGAYNFNKMSFIVAPILVYLWTEKIMGVLRQIMRI